MNKELYIAINEMRGNLDMKYDEILRELTFTSSHHLKKSYQSASQKFRNGVGNDTS